MSSPSVMPPTSAPAPPSPTMTRTTSRIRGSSLTFKRVITLGGRIGSKESMQNTSSVVGPKDSSSIRSRRERGNLDDTAILSKPSGESNAALSTRAKSIYSDRRHSRSMGSFFKQGAPSLFQHSTDDRESSPSSSTAEHVPDPPSVVPIPPPQREASQTHQIVLPTRSRAATVTPKKPPPLPSPTKTRHSFFAASNSILGIPTSKSVLSTPPTSSKSVDKTVTAPPKPQRLPPSVPFTPAITAPSPTRPATLPRSSDVSQRPRPSKPALRIPLPSSMDVAARSPTAGMRTTPSIVVRSPMLPLPPLPTSLSTPRSPSQHVHSYTDGGRGPTSRGTARRVASLQLSAMPSLNVMGERDDDEEGNPEMRLEEEMDDDDLDGIEEEDGDTHGRPSLDTILQVDERAVEGSSKDKGKKRAIDEDKADGASPSRQDEEREQSDSDDSVYFDAKENQVFAGRDIEKRASMRSQLRAPVLTPLLLDRDLRNRRDSSWSFSTSARDSVYFTPGGTISGASWGGSLASGAGSHLARSLQQLQHGGSPVSSPTTSSGFLSMSRNPSGSGTRRSLLAGPSTSASVRVGAAAHIVGGTPTTPRLRDYFNNKPVDNAPLAQGMVSTTASSSTLSQAFKSASPPLTKLAGEEEGTSAHAIVSSPAAEDRSPILTPTAAGPLTPIGAEGQHRGDTRRMPSIYRQPSKSMVDLVPPSPSAKETSFSSPTTSKDSEALEGDEHGLGSLAIMPIKGKAVDRSSMSWLIPPPSPAPAKEDAALESALEPARPVRQLTLRRHSSVPLLQTLKNTEWDDEAEEYPTYDPPPYAGGAPRDEEGNEVLPPYSNDILLAGLLPRKMEFSSPGVQAKDRGWKKVWCVLRGTGLWVYKVGHLESKFGSLASAPIAGHVTTSGFSSTASGTQANTSGASARRSTVSSSNGPPATSTSGGSGSASAGRGERNRETQHQEIPTSHKVTVPDKAQTKALTKNNAQLNALLEATAPENENLLIQVPTTTPTSRSSFSLTRMTTPTQVSTRNSSSTTFGGSSGTSQAPSTATRASHFASSTTQAARRSVHSLASHVVPSARASLETPAPIPSSSKGKGKNLRTNFDQGSGHGLNGRPLMDNGGADIGYEPNSSALLKQYTLQNAESGLATDYLKRRNVIRVRLEGEQFLLQAPHMESVVLWIEGFQAAANVALELDVRPMPKGPLFPRRRRRRRQAPVESPLSPVAHPHPDRLGGQPPNPAPQDNGVPS